MRGIAGLVLAAGLVVAGCYTGPDAAHYVAVLDELGTPAGWQTVKTVVSGPDEDHRCDPSFTITCPGAVRSFLVGADAADALAQAKDVVTAAGFAITEEFHADCTGTPSGPACTFFASRDGDQFTTAVYHSGADAGLGDDVRDGAAVLIRAHRD